MDHQRAGNDISVGKRLLIAVLLAAIVTLPFWLTHEEPVIDPVIFGDGRYKVGDVVAVKCPFRMPRQNNAQCYRTYAPQDWDAYEAGGDGGPLISILALVLNPPAGGARMPDPFMYLEGGPGFSGVPSDYDDFGSDGWLRYVYKPILETGRAMIFVDTRGLGHSEPALHCPAALRAAWQDLKQRPAERSLQSRILEADTACFRALEAEGVVPGAYQSDYAARDLAALRRGLNIEKWNLYGISYGAQTALNVLNVDAKGVRSVIFDSPSYNRVAVFQDDQAAFDRVLDQIELRCAPGGDLVNCGDGIKSKLTDLQAQLRDRPIPVRGQPFGNAVYMGDREALLVVHDALYQANGQSRALRIVEALTVQPANYLSSLSNWAMDWHQTIYWSYLDEDFSWPVHLATTCRENDHGPSTGATNWPVYTLEEQDYSRRLCEAMGISFRKKIIDAADFAGVPTLVLSGERDVITPPLYGQELAADIDGAHITHPRESHGVMFWTGDECLVDAAVDFIDALAFSRPKDCLKLR